MLAADMVAGGRYDASRAARRQPGVGKHGIGHQIGAADRGQAKIRISLRSNGIIDLGDHPVCRERFDRELRRHYVPVVAFRQSQEEVGCLGAGPPERVLVRAVSAHRAAAK